MEVNCSTVCKNERKINYKEMVYNLIATACDSDDEMPKNLVSSESEFESEEEKIDLTLLLNGIPEVLKK